MKGGKNALVWDKCNGKEEGRKYNTFVVHRGIPYSWKYWPSLRFGPKPTIKICSGVSVCILQELNWQHANDEIGTCTAA